MSKFDPESNLGHAFIGYILMIVISSLVFIGLDYVTAPIGRFLKDIADLLLLR